MLIDAPTFKSGKKKGSEGYVEKIQAEKEDWEKMLSDIPLIKKNQ